LPPTQLERFLSPLKILRSLSTDPDCPSSLLLRLVQVLPEVVTEEVEEEDEGVTEDVVATVGEVAEEEVGVELGLEPRYPRASQAQGYLRCQGQGTFRPRFDLGRRFSEVT
jgi:hypothetical protein